jgi:hypothetical protein
MRLENNMAYSYNLAALKQITQIILNLFHLDPVKRKGDIKVRRPIYL